MDQYCMDIKNPVDSERCQLFLGKREIMRKRDMQACKTLPSNAEIDECLVTLQMLSAQSRRDRQLCDQIPASFTKQRMICDYYFAYYAAGEKKLNGYQYLDRGAVKQAKQGNVLLLGSVDGNFLEVASEKGVYDGQWSWNVKFADLDNDQWQDLYVVNGWWLESNLYTNKFFHNDQGQRFHAEEEAFGLNSDLKESSYTYVDIDNDGDLDLITRAMHGYVAVYTNNEYKNNLIVFEFRDKQGNSFGIGNKVYIYYGNDERRHQLREIKAGIGYLSFDAPYAHFGLGPYKTVDKIEIHWSTGEKTVIKKAFEANKKYIVYRGEE